VWTTNSSLEAATNHFSGIYKYLLEFLTNAKKQFLLCLVNKFCVIGNSIEFGPQTLVLEAATNHFSRIYKYLIEFLTNAKKQFLLCLVNKFCNIGNSIKLGSQTLV
uniref:Uncharacterized protein n=1 Tax=Ciona intestinalis TaxID=7719 RepID=H2XV73_CIOIN